MERWLFVIEADRRATLPEALDRIRDKFNAVLPEKIFEYYFLDEEYDKQYKAEDRFMNVFTFFAGIAIFIACLGLYGLAMFTAEQKFKEIGIRKVLGASVFQSGLFAGAQFRKPCAYCIRGIRSSRVLVDG